MYFDILDFSFLLTAINTTCLTSYCECTASSQFAYLSTKTGNKVEQRSYSSGNMFSAIVMLKN